jgi:hypothetical protein
MEPIEEEHDGSVKKRLRLDMQGVAAAAANEASEPAAVSTPPERDVQKGRKLFPGGPSSPSASATAAGGNGMPPPPVAAKAEGGLFDGGGLRDPVRIGFGADRIAAARPLPEVIWNRSATKVKLEYVPPTQPNAQPHRVLERTTSMVEGQQVQAPPVVPCRGSHVCQPPLVACADSSNQVRAGRIGSISPSLMQHKRPQQLHTAILKHLLKPFSWRPTPMKAPHGRPATTAGNAATAGGIDPTGYSVFDLQAHSPLPSPTTARNLADTQ